MSCSYKCGGRCCERFPINVSPTDLGARYLAKIAFRKAGGALTRADRDLIMICEMVVPLAEEGDETPVYTCKHLDRAQGLCTVYAERPRMCEDYPGYDFGGTCQQCGFVEAPLIADGTDAESTKAAPSA
jgi:Fe-S-cluster containining protein